MSYFSVTAVHTLPEPCLFFHKFFHKLRIHTYGHTRTGATIIEKEFRIVGGSFDARHARGQWFESTTAHHLSPLFRYLSARIRPVTMVYWFL